MKDKKKHRHNSPLSEIDNEKIKRFYLQPKIDIVPIKLEEYFATSVSAEINSIDTNYENYEKQDINGNEIQLF
jgi:hypothetical protein